MGQLVLEYLIQSTFESHQGRGNAMINNYDILFETRINESMLVKFFGHIPFVLSFAAS